MCGIAGIYIYRGRAESSWILMMTDIMKHRGPDDEGFIAADVVNGGIQELVGPDTKVQGSRIESFTSNANLLLGHRRLSIIDPSPMGHQPMSNKDKTVWIVYNGEIYNYIELRNELKSLGYVFRTNSDTEVLLAAYEQWGEDCLNRFNGMWSFVIYDQRKNILFGARDRFGVKPFYFYYDQKHFAFASEQKAIVSLPFIKKEINPAAVYDFLVYGYQEYEEEGFFRNIFELLPSFAFQFNLSSNKLRKWRYYSLAYTAEWVNFSEKALATYTDNIKTLIVDAVKLRLRSDVPVGSCLSGGMDSSTIVCTINNLLNDESMAQIGERQKVFTACYRDESIDESKWARMVVERTKTSWHKTCPEANELLDDLEDLVYIQDIPFGSTTIYAQYRVMKLASEAGIKVLLDGQGGDELFTGYAGYHGTFFLEILKHFDISVFIKEWGAIDNSPVDRKSIFTLLAKIAGAHILPISLKGQFLKRIEKGNSYINADLWHTYRDRLHLSKNKAKKSLNQSLYEYMTSTNLKTLLRYEDRNAMRFSIEARTPFADDIHLIEYIFSIPSVYKIHNGWSKYLLRESTENLVPENIRKRKDKLGFSTPEYYWINKIKYQLKNYMSKHLADFIDVKRMLNDWDGLITNQTKRGHTNIWRFISLAVWKKVYSL